MKDEQAKRVVTSTSSDLLLNLEDETLKIIGRIGLRGKMPKENKSSRHKQKKRKAAAEKREAEENNGCVEDEETQ